MGVQKLALLEAELGRCQESRRKALSAATRSLVERIGDIIYLVGTSEERMQAHTYLRWLIMDTPCVPDAEKHNNVATLVIPDGKRPNMTPAGIQKIEEDTKTLIFFDGGAHLAEMKIVARLVVCGVDATKRNQALDQLKILMETKPPKPKSDPVDDKKRNIVFVVDKDEEERRRKRAARFA